MKKVVLSFTVALMALLVTTGVAAAQGPYSKGTTGVDIGWPNCTMSVPAATFGIVGVTDGLGYSTSPCLAKEASYFKNLSLYVNTGWYNKSTHINATSPKVCATGDNNCLAYNYGYNAGLYAINAARSVGVSSATWWLDVETSNTWNTNVVQNQNSLQGEHDAFVAHGATTVGVYSTTAQWQSITGSWHNNWPSWGATTWTTAKQAQTYCTGHEFTGGTSYLMQYRPNNSKIDQDVAC
ncbi:MAG TPA: hypothetical protein VF043_25690 [Ktedonobacteraceae bacterium]